MLSMIQNAGTSPGYSGQAGSAYFSLFCLSHPIGRSVCEGSSSPLLKPGGVSPEGPQSLHCPLCPCARQLKHAAWSAMTEIIFPLFFVISANNTCCGIPALCNHFSEFHWWMSVHCLFLQTGYLKHEEEKGLFHGVARVLMF